MAFCGKCGTKIDGEGKFCPACGAPIAAPAQPQPQQPQPQPQQKTDYTQKLQDLNNTPDTTAEYDPNDIAQNKMMAIFAYLGPLVLVPLFAAKTSKFARFHTNQGLVNCLAAIAFTIANAVISTILSIIRLGFIADILGLLSIVFFIFAIIGLLNASNGRAKELPLIGKFRLLK